MAFNHTVESKCQNIIIIVSNLSEFQLITSSTYYCIYWNLIAWMILFYPFLLNLYIVCRFRFQSNMSNFDLILCLSIQLKNFFEKNRRVMQGKMDSLDKMELKENRYIQLICYKQWVFVLVKWKLIVAFLFYLLSNSLVTYSALPVTV